MGRIRYKRSVSANVGLDVGAAAVRAAQVRRNGERWHVTLLGSWYPPRDEPTGAGDQDGPMRAVRWLRRLELRGRSVVAGLSPPDIELHAMELPRMPESAGKEQQDHAARWEIQRLMSFADDAAEIAYWPLPECRSPGPTAIGVAASRARLMDVLELCQAAKLECERVDATSCALARFAALFRGPAPPDDDIWGVLDLGARCTRLIVCIDETPILARVIDEGGISWTAKLADSLGVSAETAERHKRDHGIAPVARAGGAVDTARALAAMIFNVLRADLDLVAGEIERSYRYVLQCYPRRRPGPLILTGGGASLRQLDTLLAEKLGIAVRVPAPDVHGLAGTLDLSEVASRLREPLSHFACAIGLATAEE